MAHRDKIFQALRTKHKNVPKQVLDKVADHLEKGVNEENEVETSVDSADGLVSGFSSFLQSETDRRVNEALAKKKPTKEPDGGGEDDEPRDDKDTPSWAKALIESNKALSEKVTALEAGKTASAHQTRLMNGIKGIEGISEKYYAPIIAGRTFKDDAEVDSFVETVKTGWQEFSQDLSHKGLSQQSKPASGIVSTNGKVTPASKEELDSVMSKLI